MATTACQAPPTPPPGGPVGTVVVFDIDGTLTQSELSSTPHAGASAAVHAYVDKGYDVVYVTARWDALQRSSTESWLDDNGFPDLPLYMEPSLLVTDSAKVDYKTDALEEVESTTGPVTFAYGDSSSDFDAYENVDTPVRGVFALRRAGDSACQPGAWAACLPDYTAHLATIAALPEAP
jgi:phosphatidate phosphatase PAH1